MTKIRDYFQEQHEGIPLLFMDPADSYDKAIIGVISGAGVQPAVAYDYDEVIKANMAMGMTYDEACEYFSYNQEGAYMGDHTPVFIETMGEEDEYSLPGFGL